MNAEPWSEASPRNRATGDESGNALVELALGLVLCTSIILGAAELGKVAYAGIEVSNAARAGVQYGAQSHTDASDFSDMQAAALLDAPDVKGLSATASRFCLCSDGTSSTCAATDCTSSRIIEYVEVDTSAQVDPQIYLPVLPKSYNMTGKAVMRVTQ
jgi:Flp pilus assembly protein TadG